MNNEFFGARLLFVPFSVCQLLPRFHHPYLFHFQPLTFCHVLLLNVTSPFYDRYFLCYFKPISFFLILNKNIFCCFSPQSCPNLHTVQFFDRNTLWYKIKLCHLYFPIAATKINVKTICPFFCWLKTRSGGDVSLQPVMWVCLLSFSHLLFPLSSFSSVCPLLWSSLVLSLRLPLSPYKTSLYSPSCLSSRPVSQRWSSPHFLLISKQCHLFVTLSPQQPL